MKEAKIYFKAIGIPISSIINGKTEDFFRYIMENEFDDEVRTRGIYGTLEQRLKMRVNEAIKEARARIQSRYFIKEEVFQKHKATVLEFAERYAEKRIVLEDFGPVDMHAFIEELR